MAILGVGVDVVHLPRILALIQRRRPDLLARRILSIEESEEWEEKRMSLKDFPSQAKFLAVRWSLKEAGYKALFPHDKPTWKDFRVRRIHNEKPSLLYTPSSSSINRGTSINFHCSVSHDGDYLFSTVVAETV